MFAVNHPLEPEHWEEGVQPLLSCLNPWLIAHWQTCLIAAVEEPLYQPADHQDALHQIQFAHGYFNSALHELAHWCVAGAHRRTLPDFGYWYEPDGRTAEQQKQFEQVEVKPQAIEWHFAQACARTFRVSVDNLSGEPTDSLPFQNAVAEQANEYFHKGLPERAAAITQLLRQRFGGDVRAFRFDEERI